MTIEDPAREACRERCAEFGDPPCYSLDGEEGPILFTPCDLCLRDIGVDPDEPLDPTAVVRPLL